MHCVFILAAQTRTLHEWLSHPNYLPSYDDVMKWCHDMDPGSAALLLILGVVFLLFGFTIYRALIALTAAILGAYLGFGLTEKMQNMALIGLSVGAVIFGAVAWVWTNWVAAAIGAIIGGLLGSAIWQMAGAQPRVRVVRRSDRRGVPGTAVLPPFPDQRHPLHQSAGRGDAGVWRARDGISL